LIAKRQSRRRYADSWFNGEADRLNGFGISGFVITEEMDRVAAGLRHTERTTVNLPTSTIEIVVGDIHATSGARVPRIACAESDLHIALVSGATDEAATQAGRGHGRNGVVADRTVSDIA